MKKMLLLLFTLLAFWQTNAQCWDKITCGYTNSAAIKTDGSLWTWGNNANGEAGNGTLNPVPIPQQIGTGKDWAQIETNQQTFFGIKTNGTLWAWGNNANGEIGDGTTVNRTTPVQIGTDTNWKSVSAGANHTIAMKTNNTIWSWGNNEVNQLGYNGGTNNLIPTQIGSGTNWKTISAGHLNTAAIKTDGTLWTWGTKTGTEDLTIKQVGIDTNWKIVRAGYFYTAAIKNDGSLWTWGINTEGELGLGYMGNAVLVPTKVGTSTWLDVRSDWHDTCALNTDGTWWKWGQNLIEETVLTTPTLVNASNDWASISMGQFFMIGLKKDGTLWGEGINDFNQLGSTSIPWDEITLTPQLLAECSVMSTEKTTLAHLSVYPNPTSNFLNLVNANNLNIEKLTVIDITGKILLEQKSNTSQIDVQRLPAGMYFLEITTNSTKQHTKFIKE